MAAGDINIAIKSVEKLSDTDVNVAGFDTITLGSTNDFTVSAVPRTDSTGKVIYDIIVIGVELT